MNVFQSKLNTKSEAFAVNRADMLALVERMRAYESRAESLSEKRRDRFEERGQLTPRERLTRLLDPGMPFLELYNMANFLMEDPDPETSVPGGSQIAGIGFINGTRCMVLVDDSGIKAGSATASTVPKSLGVLDIAIEQKLPFVHLVESAGGNLLTYKVEQWAYGGRMFMQKAQLSAAGVPTFVVLHGPSTAGGAYQPGMSDYVIGVKDNGMAALAGAALVRAATGEVADDRPVRWHLADTRRAMIVDMHDIRERTAAVDIGVLHLAGIPRVTDPDLTLWHPGSRRCRTMVLWMLMACRWRNSGLPVRWLTRATRWIWSSAELIRNTSSRTWQALTSSSLIAKRCAGCWYRY